VVDTTSSIRAAEFWMNNYRELLATDEAALERMQALVTANAGSPDDYQPDIQLVTSEIERVKDRLSYWEDLVGTIGAIAQNS
jgi:hypothetical protein